MTVALPLRELDRVVAADVPLPNVSLVGVDCPRCELTVLVVRVGKERLPVLLEVSTVTVVADSGRVMIGHPLHDAGACATRIGINFCRDRLAAPDPLPELR